MIIYLNELYTNELYIFYVYKLYIYGGKIREVIIGYILNYCYYQAMIGHHLNRITINLDL